jgi:hypothetical protein
LVVVVVKPANRTLLGVLQQASGREAAHEVAIAGPLPEFRSPLGVSQIEV